MVPELEQSRRPKPPKPNSGGTGCLLEVPSRSLLMPLIAGSFSISTWMELIFRVALFSCYAPLRTN